MKFAVEVEMTHKAIADTMCAGIEGGYSPWLASFNVSDEVGEKFDTEEFTRWYNNPNFWASDFEITAVYDDGEFDDGESDEGDFAKTTVLKPKDLQKAFKLIAKYCKENDDAGRKNFMNMTAGDGDALTGDMLLQFFILKEWVFG